MSKAVISHAIIFCVSSLIATSNVMAMSSEKAIQELSLIELAQTYSPEKIMSITGMEKGSSFDAVLVDIGAITLADLKNEAMKSKKLNDFVKNQLDLSENYMGELTDPSLIERIKRKWQRANVIPEKELIDKLNSFIDKGYTSGYNLFLASDKSNFSKALMIRYGHSDIHHAVQLLYLMKSEGFNPKVQFTPKSSAFLYLPEWGESNNPTSLTDSGKTVAIAKEYNLDFEFKTIEDKEKFMALINKYAKKDDADEKGLLIESWWQPFYRSYTEMKGYNVMMENQILIGNYQADLLTLAKNARTQAKQIEASSKAYNVQATRVWVNPSFYRYMKGEYK